MYILPYGWIKQSPCLGKQMCKFIFPSYQSKMYFITRKLQHNQTRISLRCTEWISQCVVDVRHWSFVINKTNSLGLFPTNWHDARSGVARELIRSERIHFASTPETQQEFSIYDPHGHTMTHNVKIPTMVAQCGPACEPKPVAYARIN